ncbi:TetR/AcrR family transcriptional regulator [Actinokineospora sp. UTMC 2448]|uniref:TetR/AcrR family transcriptional regulator n=1 Tax=Actinokineospora sp. UTMC 2448 TaxID=2268449 RepID=UPI002164001A|nr:TetR/AcrR family transcriptional regulator [Actinokineospora sp. UTMC 2448]UVS79931.1 HTH-type transcriptional repressor KstR2 [Actinokineospora sp. UTMC 2448]
MTDLWPDVRPDAARRLMAAAVAAFGERGYHATTTRDIATAAGMSPAALYVHFPSKAAVLSAISRSGHEKALAMVTTAAAGPGDAAARMRVLVTEFVAWHARRHRVARIVQYELTALPQPDYEAVVALRRQTDAVVRSLIEDGVSSGVFRVSDIRSAARAVLSLGIDVARWYTAESKPDPETLGADYAGLVLAMLGAAGA